MAIILFVLSWVIVGVITYILTVLSDSKQFTVDDLSDLPFFAVLGFMAAAIVVFESIRTRYNSYIKNNKNKVIFKIKE